MDAVTRARATSFGAAGRAYAQMRPSYPAAAVRWALAGVDPLQHVVDLAAGTGKLTAVLRDELPHIALTAVEPAEGMLAQLDVPDVTKILATAEATTLATGSADAVLVAQAWHWFGPAAPTEIARVLRPGGTLAVVNHLHDGTDPAWHELFMAMTCQDSTISGDEQDIVFPLGDAFPDVEEARFPYGQRLTVEGCVTLVHSFSSWLVLDPERQARVDADVRRLAPGLAGPDGVLHLPYRTYVWKAVRA